MGAPGSGGTGEHAPEPRGWDTRPQRPLAGLHRKRLSIHPLSQPEAGVHRDPGVRREARRISLHSIACVQVARLNLLTACLYIMRVHEHLSIVCLCVCVDVTGVPVCKAGVWGCVKERAVILYVKLKGIDSRRREAET